MRPCGYCDVEMSPGDHHRLGCPQFLPANLQRGDIVKTWFRKAGAYVNYTVIDVRDHGEGGQVVLATSRFGAWRFRWWPGNYVHSPWRPVFVRRPGPP